VPVWVFGYNTRQFLAEGTLSASLAGNSSGSSHLAADNYGRPPSEVRFLRWRRYGMMPPWPCSA